MKRSAPGGETNSAKRAKLSKNGDGDGPSNASTTKKSNAEELNFSTGMRRGFKYLLDRTKIDKPPGHIQATVRMKWNLESKFALELKAPSFDPKKKEDDVLEVQLAKLHLKTLDPLKPGDKIKLLLKGGRIERTGNKKHLLPVKLLFTEGYHIRFKDQEINTFKVPPKPQVLQPSVKTEPQSTPEVPQTCAPAPPAAPTSEGPSKKDKRRESRKLAAQEQPLEPQVEAKVNEVPKPSPVPVQTSEPQAGPSHSASPGPANSPKPVQGPRIEPEEPKLQPPGEYKSLKVWSKHSYGNLIGVVLRSDPPTRSRGGDKDWMRTIRIADATKFNLYGRSIDQGISINLFAKEESHMPAPDTHDIVILKRLKGSEYHGNLQAVGWANSYSWAIFSKETRRIYYSDVKRQDPPGPNPFYAELKAQDVAYCESLMDWWNDLHKEYAEEADRSRVDAPISYGPIRRIHKLCRDLTLLAQSANEEYFDCTVEVLHAFAHEGGRNEIYTLWVTDYTKNSKFYPPEAEWCPAALAPYVFRIEFWDAAAQFASKMKERAFYHLSNTRARMNGSGYLEGKQVEAKISLLEEGDDFDHLKALIQRRKEWSKETGYVEEQFKDRLFKDADVDRFFHCTVEILHAEYREGKASTVYCTDYTSRKDLGGVPSNAPWAEGLKNRVVKFVLADGQSTIAEAVKPGDFCRFNKMRLKRDGSKGYIIGHMGGNQNLMEKLNPKNKDNRLLQDLFRRKQGLASSSLPNSTFQEILDLKIFPEKFRVSGRVVGYEPRNLDDAVALWCTACERQLVALEKMCLSCESDESLEPRCNLFLTVEDREVDRVFVSVSEKVRMSFVLRNIDLTNFLDDKSVRAEFRSRILPLVGKFYGDKQMTELRGPQAMLEVVAWLDDAKDVAFTLVAATPCPD
ncbi:hypothetical protein DFP72DRAFT_873698 [Ephemerocybe angulata]|uniref:Protection of telomeres protein 1 n=1 Tax=Ephemerocybe angulata TaxID=980116 RepID=A0A8H6IGG7_9AGAR|nr:hypothetical protein DFP72DRAFT_873698 [Tulosesus angulatus]